jgi:LPS sulfotransferase NodH
MAAVYFHHKFDHVFEGSPEPRVSFVVCSLPRSGSSLLCELLACSELAGAPSEFFDRNQMNEFRRVWGVDTFYDYLAALLGKKTSPNGVFGIKVHYHQLVESFGDTDLRTLFPNLRFVYITRSDHVRQAISFARATQTEQWSSGQHPVASPVYDREQIQSLLDWIEREEVAWESYFAAHPAPLFRVVYEEFIDAIDETVADVMRFLDVELPLGFELPAPTLDRQADALSEEWAVRFLDEGRAGSDATPDPPTP